MKNLLLFTLFLFLLTSCNDESFITEESYSNTSNITKAVIQSRNFEWEKLRYLEFIDNSKKTRIVPAPWIGGSGLNLGVPRQFQDFNFKEESSENLYSTKNGWRLLYHNMDLIGDPYKYLVLYNRYTGIARAFFLSIATSNSTTNTNSTFIGFRVTGNSSLLNYTSQESFDSSKKFYNSSFITSPTKPFNMPIPNQLNPTKIDNFGVGYENERWYAAEIELSYDPNLTNSNTLDIQITAAQTSLSYTSGKFSGQIEGTITTKGSTPASINLDLSKTTTNTVNVSAGGDEAKTILESNTNSNGSFFNKLKSNASKWISDAFNKSGKELVNGIFSKGSGAIVDAFGSLLNSYTGLGGVTQESKVNLDFNGTINLNTTTFVPTNGWGQILGLPTTGQNQLKLYPGKLGVWSLSETPKFSASFYIVGYYQNRDPYGQIMATDSEASLYISNRPTIILNPDLVNEYNIKDLRTAVCFASPDTDRKNISIFGMTNNRNTYSNTPYSSECFPRDYYNKNNFINNAGSDYAFRPSSLYAGLYNLDLYYFVSFKLEPKNGNGKEVYFSRYIKAELNKDQNSSVSFTTRGI